MAITKKWLEVQHPPDFPLGLAEEASPTFTRYDKDRDNPLSSPVEVRVKDPTTGGEKGQKLARFSLIPPEFLWALAEHYGKGATKYAERNWERGYKWSLTWDALQRHLHQFAQGEVIDPETGSNHLIAAAWHCVALFTFYVRGIGTNDIQPEETE